MKKWIIFAVVLCIAYGAYYYAREQDRKVDGFYPNRITSIFPDDPKWDIDVSQAEVAAASLILKQPYHYLAHGFQCYAFVSADDKYVLKFIRQQRLKPPVVIEWLPNILFFKSIKEQRVQMGQKRANYLFRSLKVSFEDVPEETGMLLVHLNKTKDLYPTVELIDKAGNRYSVKLDDYEFVLQKKALPIKPTISKLMAEGDVSGAKERVDQIFDLLVTCAKKGIADMDNQLIRKNNLGFLPDRAIYIDTGKITRKESMKTRVRFAKDLERLQPLYVWLQEHYPELAEHFLAKRERVLANFT
ncbi:MAG: hypothetical protein LLF94_00665 [Chlamydiales bacterium]|nr:hypothetical protein [Chlamydiales bacterium]